MFSNSRGLDELAISLEQGIKDHDMQADKDMAQLRQVLRNTIKYAMTEASFTMEAIVHGKYGRRHLPHQQERQEAIFEDCKRLNQIAREHGVQPVYLGSYRGTSQSFMFAVELTEYLLGKAMTEMTTRERGGRVAEAENDGVELDEDETLSL